MWSVIPFLRQLSDRWLVNTKLQRRALPESLPPLERATSRPSQCTEFADGPREIRGRNILCYSSPHASQTSNLPDLVIDSVQVPLWKWWMRTKSKGQD
jgi:hypothetical protein